jgi:hypothetical protein
MTVQRISSLGLVCECYTSPVGHLPQHAPMSEQDRLIKSVATTISDYRTREISRRTSQHVQRWIDQFPAGARYGILAELEHVLSRTYQSRKKVESFLSTVLNSRRLAGTEPCKFWEQTRFLNIQSAGNSQCEMLKLFEPLLENRCGLELGNCGRRNPSTFIYLDDVLFTGNRVLRDIISWINSDAPRSAQLHVATIGMHTQGQQYARRKIREAIAESRKSIQISWWKLVTLEDRRSETYTSDVLRPTRIPPDREVRAYVESLGFPVVLRRPGSVGTQGYFSSEAGRDLLEQQFLIQGVHIRSICPNLNVFQRPLGNSVLATLGFGSMVATFRNCPNNAPLVLWAGDPWYPLLPRKTN